MPKPKRPRDPNQRAKSIVAIATGEQEDTVKDDRNPAAVVLGRLGGTARAKALSKKKLTDIAKKAAEKRWRSTKK